jgi:hypothetical protein
MGRKRFHQKPFPKSLQIPMHTVQPNHQRNTEGEASMSKKMTPWFPVNIKPVHVGVYETDLAGYLGYSYWNGKYWSDTSFKLDMERVIKRRRGMQNKEWRGFKEKQA